LTLLGAIHPPEFPGQPPPCFDETPTIVGTHGQDLLQGTSGPDVIAGLAGDDFISGGGGPDLICGAEGNDTLNGNGAGDSLSGGPGDDTLDGGTNGDTIHGDGGIDACEGGPGSNSVGTCEEPRPVATPPPPAAVELVDAFPGQTFDFPVAAAAIPGLPGAYLVLERGGLIFLVDSGGKHLAGDLGQVPTAGEGGVWNLAFTSGFGQEGNQYVYLYYAIDLESSPEVVDVGGQLSRFEFASGQLSGEVPLLTLTDGSGSPEDTYANIHNGGGLAFGPDGYLYVGVGDGGPQEDPREYGQDVTKLAGKVLRLDVENVDGDGDLIPAANPFAGEQGCSDGCDEIFAYGFRNPWRLTFDSGNLWVADVGLRNFEEIDIVTAGENYGWDAMEGPACRNEPGQPCTITGVPPVAYYAQHRQRRGAISGGFVYRGDDIPGLVGYYISGDFQTGTLRATLASAPYDTTILLETDLAVVSFAEDADREVLVIDVAGRIYRLVAAP
jgi:glucose/arabinose dehydrogenase